MNALTRSDIRGFTLALGHYRLEVVTIFHRLDEICISRGVKTIWRWERQPDPVAAAQIERLKTRLEAAQLENYALRYELEMRGPRKENTP